MVASGLKLPRDDVTLAADLLGDRDGLGATIVRPSKSGPR